MVNRFVLRSKSFYRRAVILRGNCDIISFSFCSSFSIQVLHDGEGPIHAVKWRTSLIAWANDAGVKIYDMANNQRISFIERPRGSPRPELLLPHLVWQVCPMQPHKQFQ